MRTTFGRRAGFPDLQVLDSTDPGQVSRVEGRLELNSTLFVVSSKSGSTLEPNIFKQHFFERARRAAGGGQVGNRFIAITDPGSRMEQVARQDRFRRIFSGVAGIGGRYSALSHFGMVPAALMGVDVARFLDRTEMMVNACGPDADPERNPGVALGAILGAAATLGRDKLTVIASPGIQAFGAWLEQLIAESTGKSGKGIIPVDSERLGTPGVYGNDRLFIHVRLGSGPDLAQDEAVAALAGSGQAVVTILVETVEDLGQEFFRWEIATAVAGSILGINPFDQPDVEASKVATRELTSAYERLGSLPEETPVLKEDGLTLFTDAANAAKLATAAGGARTLEGCLGAHLGRLGPRDYFCISAYVEMSEEHHAPLSAIRHKVRDAFKVATCLGYGPRFLHSTGQLYKGGPDSGVFLQITCDDAEDLPVPGHNYTFGVVKAAQARGDFEVLAQRGRRALRVHIGGGTATGLEALKRNIERVLIRRDRDRKESPACSSE